MEKILILDSNSLMNRAYYALPPLSNSQGVHTNAIYGFTNMLFKLMEDISPDYIVAAFDRKAPTFRHKDYAEYKAGRKSMPEELRGQFPLIKELLALMGVKIYEIDGFEADDIIGTIAKLAEKNNALAYVVSGDKDTLQLASDSTKVIITKKGVSETLQYDKQAFIDEYGITPTQFIDVKGLMGDKSDNIPGVPGVGEKTALKLIKTYGSVEEVLSHLHEISGKKLVENLTNYSEDAIFSKKLATIYNQVPLDLTFDDIKEKEEMDKKALSDFVKKLEIKSLVNRYAYEEEKVEVKVDVEVIDGIESLEKLRDIKEGKLYITYNAIDTVLYSRAEIQNLNLCYDSKVYELHLRDMLLTNEKEVLSILKDLMENEALEKIIHDSKELILILSKYNIELRNLAFDTALGAYIIDSSKGEYAIDKVADFYLGIEFKGEPLEVNGKCAYILEKLSQVLKEKLKNDSMENLYYNVELPLVFVLASMEKAGFRINEDMLRSLEVKFKVEIDKTKREIFDLAEEEFNINSTKQLGRILFDKLDLPILKKTKTGYSTNAEVLEKLKDNHEIIPKIIYYRQIAKLNSTYVEGLFNVIDVDNKIHSTFNQLVTTTGRLSSTEPNLQNIPVKYEMGREIRKVFIPENEGEKLLSCDYSQIELRVLAHMAKDENMIEGFKGHSDIHRKTASEVFNVQLEEVTQAQRSSAKAVNFGIVYGMSAFSLSQDLKISKKEAEEYMNIYFERYPKIKGYLEDAINEAREKGYVTTILNRRRFIPEVNISNKMVKALGERLAMNAPIQGSAADIIKIAMVNVYERLKKEDLESKLILQVHDELILNVVSSEEDKVKALVKEEMEKALDLLVPMEVDVKEGYTWYEAK